MASKKNKIQNNDSKLVQTVEQAPTKYSNKAKVAKVASVLLLLGGMYLNAAKCKVLTITSEILNKSPWYKAGIEQINLDPAFYKVGQRIIIREKDGMVFLEEGKNNYIKTGKDILGDLDNKVKSKKGLQPWETKSLTIENVSGIESDISPEEREQEKSLSYKNQGHIQIISGIDKKTIVDEKFDNNILKYVETTVPILIESSGNFLLNKNVGVFYDLEGMINAYNSIDDESTTNGSRANINGEGLGKTTRYQGLIKSGFSFMTKPFIGPFMFNIKPGMAFSKNYMEMVLEQLDLNQKFDEEEMGVVLDLDFVRKYEEGGSFKLKNLLMFSGRDKQNSDKDWVRYNLNAQFNIHAVKPKSGSFGLVISPGYELDIKNVKYSDNPEENELIINHIMKLNFELGFAKKGSARFRFPVCISIPFQGAGYDGGSIFKGAEVYGGLKILYGAKNPSIDE